MGKQVTLFRKQNGNPHAVDAVMVPQPQQTPEKHSIRGRIVDENNEPVIGATVKVNGKNTIGAVTDMDGNYILNNVSPRDVITIPILE